MNRIGTHLQGPDFPQLNSLLSPKQQYVQEAKGNLYKATLLRSYKKSTSSEMGDAPWNKSDDAMSDTKPLSNNSGYLYQRSTILDKLQDDNPVAQAEYAEIGNYYIDVLKDEFCNEDPDGFLTFKQEDSQVSLPELMPTGPPSPYQVPAFTPVKKKGGSSRKSSDVSNQSSTKVPSPIFKIIKTDQLKTGPWTPEEHQLFLEALKTYGKDWESIQKFIRTREEANIRAHAQKFLRSLVRLIENKRTKLKLSMQEAQFYFGILNKKVHKSVRKQDERERIEQLKKEHVVPQKVFDTSSKKSTLQKKLEDMTLNNSRRDSLRSTDSIQGGQNTFYSATQMQSQFDQWREHVHEGLSDKSMHSSLGRSIKFRDQKSTSNKSVLSFKPMFQADWEALSQRTMSDRMSDTSMLSTGSLSLKVKANVPKKWDATPIKQHFAKKYADNPEIRWKLEMKLDEITEEVNDNNNEDLDTKAWKKKYYIEVGPEKYVTIFDETTPENYRDYLKMILLEGVQFRKLNFFKAMLMMVQYKSGKDDLTKDLQELTPQLLDQSWEEMMETCEQIAKENQKEKEMNQLPFEQGKMGEVFDSDGKADMIPQPRYGQLPGKKLFKEDLNSSFPAQASPMQRFQRQLREFNADDMLLPAATRPPNQRLEFGSNHRQSHHRQKSKEPFLPQINFRGSQNSNGGFSVRSGSSNRYGMYSQSGFNY